MAWADAEAVFPHLHPTPARRAALETLIRVHWLLGGRPQDLCGMRPADVDRADDLWAYHVDRHKNEHRDDAHSYWIGPKAQQILRPLLDGCPADRPVFVYPGRGKSAPRPIDRTEYARRVKRACAAAGVKAWTPHQLRHSRATEIMRIYESNDAAAAAIGDTPGVTREVYVDPIEAVRRRIARETG